MKVSVVIPAYNAAAFVAETVGSVLAQTRPAAEVIVVDDGSTDGTAGVVAGFGPPVRVIRQANAGVSAARNAGVAAATGDVVAFVDADDVWHPEHLARLLGVLDARPEVGLVAADVYDWPAAGHPALPAAGGVLPVPLADLVVRNSVVTSAVAVRAEILRKAGPFDLALHGPEDHDLWLRVAQQSAVVRLALPLTGYRTVPTSLSKQAARMTAGMRRILVKLDAAGVFAGRPRLKRKAWGYFRYSAGYMHLAAGFRRAAAEHAALSLVGYPLPYSRADVRQPFGRVRLLVAAVRGGGRS